MPTPKLNIDYLVQGQSLGEVTQNTATNILESVAIGSAIDATLTAEPSSPNEGDVYIVPASATGTNWAGEDGKLAIYYSGWYFITPEEGMRFWVKDEDSIYVYDGSAWAVLTPTSINLVDDLTPQLGGDLDTNENPIVSTGNNDININPAGTGQVKINGVPLDTAAFAS